MKRKVIKDIIISIIIGTIIIIGYKLKDYIKINGNTIIIVWLSVVALWLVAVIIYFITEIKPYKESSKKYKVTQKEAKKILYNYLSRYHQDGETKTDYKLIFKYKFDNSIICLMRSDISEFEVLIYLSENHIVIMDHHNNHNPKKFKFIIDEDNEIGIDGYDPLLTNESNNDSGRIMWLDFKRDNPSKITKDFMNQIKHLIIFEYVTVINNSK